MCQSPAFLVCSECFIPQQLAAWIPQEGQLVTQQAPQKEDLMGDSTLDSKCELLVLWTAENGNVGGINRSGICETPFGTIGGLLLKY